MPRRTLRAPTAVTLDPIRPSAALLVAYQRKLEALVDQMDKNVLTVITQAYHAEGIGQDAGPADRLAALVRRLTRDWQRRFDELAPEIARYFATSIYERSDMALKSSLRRAGFTVRLKLTPAVRDVVQAAVAENVTLIKSLASQHMTQVQGAVMRSVAAGRDLASLTDDLVKQAGVTRRRAAFIARDQNDRATATIARQRQLDLGIIKAKWLHSAGGNHPRPEHVAFSGKIYDVARGHDFDNGEGIVWPGTAINCRCVSVPVVPGFDD